MYNVYGVICGTYDEACEVAGIETPAQLEAEARFWAAEEAIEAQDAMEARGGPVYGSPGADDDIPF